MKKAISKAKKNWNPDKEVISIEIVDSYNIKSLYFKEDQDFIKSLIKELASQVELYNEHCYAYDVLICQSLELEIDIKLEILNDFFNFARKIKEMKNVA